MSSTDVVLVTGLSGAGKSSILRVLEDLGFEAVDNPPLPLVEGLVMEAAKERRRLAIGVDVRTRGFKASAILETLDRLGHRIGQAPDLIYASAETDVIQRRFTETRRRHPLAGDGTISDGIVAEHALTAPLRTRADLVVDTTHVLLRELRRLIEDRFGGGAEAAHGRLTVTVLSFAFPAGLPRTADMVFDVRFLSNPHYVEALRDLSGVDAQVVDFLNQDPDCLSFITKVSDICEFVLPLFVREGKKYVTIGIGCTGGRHRSVMVGETLTRILRASGWSVSALHRELALGGRLQDGWTGLA